MGVGGETGVEGRERRGEFAGDADFDDDLGDFRGEPRRDAADRVPAHRVSPERTSCSARANCSPSRPTTRCRADSSAYSTRLRDSI